MLGAVFMASEGLTRRAFPHHPQLWRAWSREAAGTQEIVGRTAGGYLFVPIELAFIAAFYFLTNRYLGWWQPSEQLTNPNILASAVPALTPIAISLQAGIMEECLFRAVPLALGALIGARYGVRRLGIAIALVLQAIVFGAAHANYPGLPAYSRMVELFLPSLVWGVIFLRYGLAADDSPARLVRSGAHLDSAVPHRRARGRRAARAGDRGGASAPCRGRRCAARRRADGRACPRACAMARGWRRRRSRSPSASPPLGTLGPYAVRLQRALPVLGVAGLAAWLAFTPLRADVPAVAIDRDAAVAAARSALAERGVVLGADWTGLAIPRSALEDATERLWHAFVWREAGPRAYRTLVGNALAPPLWDVRFARFEGDVAERAEEWRVTVRGDGRIWQIAHRLPEGRPGATLTRDEAQSLAERTLHRQLGSDAGALLLRGADQAQRPNRRDWLFAYVDPRIDVGKSGEARVRVGIAGDEVAVADRSLFVPEAWQRAEVERVGRRDLVRTVALGIIASVIVVALVYAVRAWSKGRSDRRALIAVGALLFAMVIASSANNWPMRAFYLRTVEPLSSQILLSVLAMVAGGVLLALLVGLLAGVGARYARQEVVGPPGRPAFGVGLRCHGGACHRGHCRGARGASCRRRSRAGRT